MEAFRENDMGASEVRVDWSKPVVVFDPWPFAEEAILMKPGTWYIGGSTWDRDERWYLFADEAVLGVATDGNHVIGGRADFEKELNRDRPEGS